jgi:diguanylate cyclase (GGDEF)-like protein/PAS domain S-box-containing protein
MGTPTGAAVDLPPTALELERARMEIRGVVEEGPELMADALFGACAVGLVVADASGRVVDVNPALCDLLGLSRQDVVGMEVWGFAASEDRVRLAAAVHDVIHGGRGPLVVEHRCVTAGGQDAWSGTTVVAVPVPGGSLRLVLSFVDLTQRHGLEATIEHMGAHDSLTGLATRQVFYDRLRARLGSRRPSGRGLAVLVLNLNRFQQVNAGLGHLDADLVLAEVGRRLTAATRRQDTVARMGGDWFAVMAPGITAEEDAVALAVALRQRVGEAYWAGQNLLFVSARVGVAVAPAHGRDPVTLVRKATSASETAKGLTGGWALSPAGDRTVRGALGLVSDLRIAVAAETLSVDYQPIVDGDGQVHALEALARWTDPSRGKVPPDQFIVLAEQNGLIRELTELILRRAVEQAVRWRSDTAATVIAVNLSRLLLGDVGVVDHIEELLRSLGLPASALTLEITETAVATGSHEAVRSSLHALRDLGVRISIDDFGTGYSALSYLKDLPIDELKIDRSFVAGLHTDVRSERIIRSITDLAHSLDLVVVAEGVEDEGTASLLLRLGADHLQGYAIARPADAATVTDWLQRRDATRPSARQQRQATRRLHVLVVDEHVAARQALRQRLRDRDHRVVEAHSGRTALARLHQQMPDLVILDDLLPGQTGVETAPQLRAAGYAGPILLYSGSTPADLAAITYPLDVWPVSQADDDTLMRLIDGYASKPPARPTHPSSA